VSKPSFALDLDGVCYNWDSTVRYLLEEHRGVKVPSSTSWGTIQANCSNNDWLWLWSEGVRKGMFRHGHLYKGTVDATQELATLVDLYAVTSRPYEAKQDTIDWLAFHKIPVVGMHFVYEKGAKKSQWPMDFHLDDSPSVLQDLADTVDGEVICWDRPWNQDAPCDHRVSTWKEVIDIVKAA
jgi:5'(3')-deoxyribonucleotidase